jgi:GNAT superfamily N-acetyltransferase
MTDLTYTLEEGPFSDTLTEAVGRWATDLLGGFDAAEVPRRLATVARPLLLTARLGDEVVGFKLGYAESEAVFYSWLGGVQPAYRQQGIARELMQRQHDWCRRAGFRRVRMKTRNQWKFMLILSLRSGFEISETYAGADGVLRIVLEKSFENQSV